MFMIVDFFFLLLKINLVIYVEINEFSLVINVIEI